MNEPANISENDVRRLSAYVEGLFPGAAVAIIVARQWQDRTQIKLGVIGNMESDRRHLALLKTAALHLGEKIKLEGKKKS